MIRDIILCQYDTYFEEIRNIPHVTSYMWRYTINHQICIASLKLYSLDKTPVCLFLSQGVPEAQRLLSVALEAFSVTIDDSTFTKGSYRSHMRIVSYSIS